MCDLAQTPEKDFDSSGNTDEEAIVLAALVDGFIPQNPEFVAQWLSEEDRPGVNVLLDTSNPIGAMALSGSD